MIRSSGANSASRSNGRIPTNLSINELLSTPKPSWRFHGPRILVLPTQRLEPRFRLLDSCGVGVRIEILRFDRIAARPVSSPFGKDQWIKGFCEREARLSATHLDGALQHNPRRADVALPEQPARARNQPCRHRSFLGIGLGIAACARSWCPVGDWIVVLPDGLVPRNLTDRHSIGRNVLR